jgi:threonine dehydrogenase-like Zn-dependent dehydrogenase
VIEVVMVYATLVSALAFDGGWCVGHRGLRSSVGRDVLGVSMKAVTFAGHGKVRLDEAPQPGLQIATDAILKVTAAGICGSDLHLLDGKIPGMAEGSILGHEIVGVVDDVGDAVTSVAPGTRVVASMQTACGGCHACSRRDFRNCSAWSIFGLGPFFGDLQGGQAEYVRIPRADMTLAKVPDAINDDTAVLMADILPTAYSAIVRAGVRPGDTVAVVGAGPVGQLAVMCAQLFGASKVFAIDFVASRLAEAERLGAIAVDAGAVDAKQFIGDLTDLGGADIVVEAVGSEAAIATAWSVARAGAVIALVGILVDEPWPTSAGESYLNSIDVRPILGDSVTHRWDLMRMTESGRIDPGSIISHRLSLDDAVGAYDMFIAKEATKVVLHP